MTTVGDPRGLARLALPLCLSQLGLHLMTVVDTAILGRYADASMAGVGLAGNLFFAVTVVGMGVCMGLDTLVPQALGAGRPAEAHGYLAAGIRLALALTVPVSVVVAAIAIALPHTGVEGAVAREGAAFLYGRLPGVAPFLLATTLRSYLQAHRVTRPILFAVVVGNLVNALLDLLLIFGDGGLVRIGLPPVGLPALGAVGSALATTVASCCTVAIYAAAARTLHREDAAETDAATAAPRLPAMRARVAAIVRLGGPVGLQLLAEVGIFSLVGLLAGRLGQAPAAAHQVALMLASLSFSLALGIGTATSVQVGRAVGAGDASGARRAGAQGMWAAALLMGGAGLLFLLAPHALARAFSDTPEVIATALPLLRVAALFQLSDAVQAVSAGALRGAGATRFTFVANLVGHYAIGLPVAWSLGIAAGLGAPGLWWGLSAGLTAVALAQSTRFFSIVSRARMAGRPA